MIDKKLEEIIQEVIRDLDHKDADLGIDKAVAGNQGTLGVFPTIDEAVSAARKAFVALNQQTLQQRSVIIKAMRDQGKLYARELAVMAREETGFGDVEAKVVKNLLVCEKTPGYEIIRPVAMSGDQGLTVLEYAPFGVIGSITPVTNPTATIINNAISIIAAGNAVVFNVHPRAKNVSIKTIQLLNQTIIEAGGPQNILTGIIEPTIESAQYLMKHDGIDLLLVTGGPAVVKVAMASGKRAICAGPGNPPVVVDETADIDKAGRDIVLGASFDNNLPCTCEKEIIVVEKVAEALKNSLINGGGLEIKGDAIKRLEAAIFSQHAPPYEHATMNMDLIGHSATNILKHAGIDVDDKVRMAFFETGPEHPLVWTEQMMPVLPLVRVRSFEEAKDLAKRAEQEFRHTAGLHSMDIRNLSSMAKEINTSLFIKNGPHYGGLGYGTEGYASFSIGTFTREGLTTAKSFTWERKCALVDHLHIV